MTENIEISKEIKTDTVQVNIQIPSKVIVPDVKKNNGIDLLQNQEETEENKWSNFFFQPAQNDFIDKVE